MKALNLATAVTLFGLATAVQAVPVLQVGAPGGTGEGTYANYVPNSTDPTETDTAFTSGGTIYVAGIYQNQNVLSLGGQATGGTNWTANIAKLPTVFDNQDAILLVSVPEGTLASALTSLTVNGAAAFYSDATNAFFPNNHDPVKAGIADFLFFNIGDFSKIAGAVPDFASETGAADGQIKSLTVAGFGDLAWIHFDVMALETSEQGKTSIVTTLENNPGSHDVTWKPGDDDDNTGGDDDDDNTVPEPGSLALFGAGLLAAGLGGLRRRRRW